MTFRSENIIGFVFWWCFTSYHGIHHHLSPPFGRKNWNFFQASSRRKFPSSEILLLTLTDLTVYGTGILYVPKIYHQNQRKKTLANISKAGLVVGEWSIFPGFSPNLQTNLTKTPGNLHRKAGRSDPSSALRTDFFGDEPKKTAKRHSAVWTLLVPVDTVDGRIPAPPGMYKTL